MAGVVPAIHAFKRKDVDARHKAGHDDIVTPPACAAQAAGFPA